MTIVQQNGNFVRGARFLFYALAVSDPSQCTQWNTETTSTAPEPMPEVTCCYVWTLVSANNRELGRSASTFHTFSECRESVVRIRDEADRIETRLASSNHSGEWAWQVVVDGELVAVSRRNYLREREARYSLDKFTKAILSASVTDAVRPAQVRRRETDHRAVGGGDSLGGGRT